MEQGVGLEGREGTWGVFRGSPSQCVCSSEDQETQQGKATQVRILGGRGLRFGFLPF